MLALMTYGTCAALAVMAVHQAACTIWFCSVMGRGRRSPLPARSRGPTVAILMSLRGADHGLKETLRRLTAQDYADYFIHLVIDSLDDPSWKVAQESLASSPIPSSITVLEARRTTCGLQCSAFVQAAEALPPDVEVVVTVDGDIMPGTTWLRELVAPLQDRTIGATFGNRWFAPQRRSWGSLTRAVWNIGAIIPMTAFAIPWGGCMAVRRSAMTEAKLLQRWGTSIVHDAPVHSSMAALGLKTHFVPALMMPIREGCDISFCFDFITRQLLWTRTYHPAWFVILAHAIGAAAPFIIAVVLLPWLFVRGEASLVNALVAGIAGYLLTAAALAVAIDACVIGVLRRSGDTDTTPDWIGWALLPLTIPLTQILHGIAAVRASFMQHVRWRGVTYEIRGPWSITLLQDQPYREAAAARGGSSL